MMAMEKLSVGDKREAWKQPDGFLVEYGGDGSFTLFVFLDKPTTAEKVAVLEGKLEIGFSIYDGVGLFTYRFGGMVEGESAYLPNLYKAKLADGKKPYLDEGAVLSFIVLLIDGGEGELQGIRYISTDRAFSRYICTWNNMQLDGRYFDNGTVRSYGIKQFRELESRNHYNTVIDGLQARAISELHAQAVRKWNYRDEKDMENEEKGQTEAERGE